MSGLIVDASVAAAWCFDDEASPPTDDLMNQVRDGGGAVPALWRWELANVLALAVQSGRIDQAKANVRLNALEQLPIQVDAEAPARAWRETFTLAQANKLTVYDAAYLELAIRLALPLATLDKQLRQAAKNVGVQVLP